MPLDRNISSTKRLKNNNTDLKNLTLSLSPRTEIYYYEQIPNWTIKSFFKYKERRCFSSKKFVYNAVLRQNRFRLNLT